MRIWVALVLLATPLLTAAQDNSSDALKLLDRVVAQYQNAQYLHVEAEQTDEESAPHERSLRSAKFSVWLAVGGRFRYVAEDSQGSGQAVSDGATEWRQMDSFAAWSKAPAGTFFHSPVLSGGDNNSLINARNVVSALKMLGSELHAVHFAPDETIESRGKTIRCAVIRFDAAERDRLRNSDLHRETTVWIDRANLTIRKMESRDHTAFYFGGTIPPHAPRFDLVTTTTYTVVDLNFEPTADSFVYNPGKEVHEVANLPTGMPPGATTAHSGLSDAERMQARLVGKTLPDVTLRDADGKEMSLARFRGHPVFIVLWATWCSPCLEELPMLNRIHESTASSDLQMISINEDFHSEDAAALLKRRGYTWQDFSFNKDVGKSLDSGSIPQLLLIDATGKVVYYSIGGANGKEVATAIAKLGPQYSGVKADD